MADLTPQAVIDAYLRDRKRPDRAEYAKRQREWLLKLREDISSALNLEVSDETPETVEAALQEYLKLRELRREEKAKFESVDSKFKTAMRKIEGWLGGRMEAAGVDNMKCAKVALTYFETTRRFSVVDRQAVEGYVLRTGDFSIFNGTLNGPGVRAIIGENFDLSKLPGIEMSSERNVIVRRV